MKHTPTRILTVDKHESNSQWAGNLSYRWIYKDGNNRIKSLYCILKNHPDVLEEMAHIAKCVNAHD